jgi:hypothetical protein
MPEADPLMPSKDIACTDDNGHFNAGLNHFGNLGGNGFHHILIDAVVHIAHEGFTAKF